jgi:cephalosporin hydroxylase
MIEITLQSPVPVLQSEWEFKSLLRRYTQRNNTKVVEVGSFYGGTLWYWIHFNENLKSLTSIDYPIGPSDARYEEMLRCRAMWPEWTAGIEFHDIQGDSHNSITVHRVKQLYPANDVDFLFIDGDHSYQGVKADFENYSPLVRPGGLVVLHDISGLPEVRQYWQEIKPHHKTTEIFEPGGWGIGIIEV